MFEFINISNIIHVNIVADSSILVIIESIGTIMLSLISSTSKYYYWNIKKTEKMDATKRNTTVNARKSPKFVK